MSRHLSSPTQITPALTAQEALPRYPLWQRLCSGWSRDQWLQLLFLLLGIALLVGGLLLPLLTMLQKSLQDADGAWVGLANVRAYFDSPHLGRTIANTLWLGVLITTLNS